METKQIKISELVPQGYEIDKEQSTFENIILKPIEVKLPLSVEEIQGRCYYLNMFGDVCKTEDTPAKNHLSTEKRAKAFLALMQLVELRDAWNGDWKVDWESMEVKFCISFYDNKIKIIETYGCSIVLHFKTRELAEKFAEQFKDLINEAKELL